jgi:BA14K-like protein
MEPTMISLKVLSTATAMALVVSLAPAASFAENHGRAGFAARGGAAPAARFSGGGARMGGAVAQFHGNGGGAVAQFRGGGGGGGYRHDRGRGGFIPGAVAGAVIGGALASDSYAYYGGPGYYAPGYDDGQYYDDGAVAVVPAPVGGDDVAFCAQTYRSYDPASGTYLGYDGLRHPCP